MIAVLAWVGYGSFIAARELTDTGTSEADPVQPEVEDTQFSPVPEHELIDAERTKPRFQGELLGVYMAPNFAGAPAGIVELNNQLRAEVTNCVGKFAYQPVETAQRFGLSFTPPAGFDLVRETTSVSLCSETGAELDAYWEYHTQFNGFKGRVRIVRTFPVEAWDLDVAAERVSTITAGGQEAILVAPVLPEDGYGSFALVMFPRQESFTYITSNNVPLDELLKIADSVGQGLAKSID